MKKFLKISGQTFVEYTLLIGVSITILVVLTPMIKRGTQAMVKVVSDQVGVQQNAEQLNNGNGGLLKSDVTMLIDRSQRKKEWNPDPGVKHSTETTFTDRTVTDTQTASDLGFTPKD